MTTIHPHDGVAGQPEDFEPPGGVSFYQPPTTPPPNESPWSPSGPLPRRPTKWTWWIVVAIVAVAAATISGIVSTIGGNTVTGTVDVYASSGTFTEGSSCTGASPNEDLYAGTPVWLSDDDEHTLVTTSLQGGTAVSDSDCQFTFNLGSLPDKPGYVLRIGNDHGTLSYTSDEITSDGNELQITIGDQDGSGYDGTGTGV